MNLLQPILYGYGIGISVPSGTELPPIGLRNQMERFYSLLELIVLQ